MLDRTPLFGIEGFEVGRCHLRRPFHGRGGRTVDDSCIDRNL